MPRRDGTGPTGAGEMTGRRLGVCTGVNAVNYGAVMGYDTGLGLSCRRGLGRGFRRFAIVQTAAKTQKDLLQEQKELLQSKIDIINNRLENL